MRSVLARAWTSRGGSKSVEASRWKDREEDLARACVPSSGGDLWKVSELQALWKALPGPVFSTSETPGVGLGAWSVSSQATSTAVAVDG